MISSGEKLAVYVSDQVPEFLIGDPGRIRQIITNLMGNSIKFTERGHILVSVHLVEEFLTTSKLKAEDQSTDTLSGFPVADRRRSWKKFKIFNQDFAMVQQASSDKINLIISVEDTGVGIPREAQARVFTPFMQVGPSISRIHGGTGIGLSISKCLVSLMRGEIGFVSEPQIGSTFSFTAILTRGHTNSREYRSTEFQGMTALVVDDRPARAEVTKYHLRRLGIDIEHSISITQIPRVNGTFTFDMVLIEKETWLKDEDLWPVFANNVRTGNQSVIPKTFLLANPTSSTKNNFVNSIENVIMKPLRASMLQVSLQRVMGSKDKDNNRNGEHPPLSLHNLLHGRHVLVVDDNMVNLRVAAGALKKYGAEVTCEESGKKAAMMLRPPHKFDACFMDIQMPEMDGFEATRRIRKWESDLNDRIKHGEISLDATGNVMHWHVPILAMTADVIQATQEKCTKCGMDGYVSKPFEAEQLYREVARFFSVKKTQ